MFNIKMKNRYLSFVTSLMALTAVQFSHAAGYLLPAGPSDPAGSDIHMAYESATFTPGHTQPHLPGADLAAPGDRYRFTLIRKDQYANDPNYGVVKAIAGVHIDDYDWSKESLDSEPEWGRILINGETKHYINLFPWDKRTPESSNLLEIASDAEFSPADGDLIPPYIFDVTEETKKSQWLVFEVINLRKDGSTSVQSDSPFGDFVVNRIGYHVWYKKK